MVLLTLKISGLAKASFMCNLRMWFSFEYNFYTYRHWVTYHAFRQNSLVIYFLFCNSFKNKNQ